MNAGDDAWLLEIRTRAQSLSSPTQLAARIFAAGRELLRREVGTTRFRLIDIGVSNVEDAQGDDLADLLGRRGAQAEHAVDKLRASSAWPPWSKAWRWRMSRLEATNRL